LTGTVRDGTGAPIPDVMISTLAANRSTRTDSAGHFSLSGLRPGPTAFGVRRIGFDSAAFTMQLDTGTTAHVNVTLAELPLALPVVTSMADARARQFLKAFYARKDAGQGGHFIVRSDIEARRPRVLSDLLRGIPGVQLQRQDGRDVVQMRQSLLGRDCPVGIWVDGSRMQGLFIDDISPRDVEAIEVYSGAATVPPAFKSQPAAPGCGTIAIWTRVP
jgi:outer membrane receptor protein involved in Fe transport